MVLHQHHRDVVEFDRVGQSDERSAFGADLGRLIVIDPIADVFDPGLDEEFGRFVSLRQARAEPAPRPSPGETFEGIERLLDHRALVVDPVDRHLLPGVAHEFPAGFARRRRHPLIGLADPRVDR